MSLLADVAKIFNERRDLLEKFVREVRVSPIERDPIRCPPACAQHLVLKEDERGGFSTTVWGEISWT